MEETFKVVTRKSKGQTTQWSKENKTYEKTKKSTK
jgi:hypothetical protein